MSPPFQFSFKNSEVPCFLGDDVVSDAPKRFSGTFSRTSRSLQSRTPEPEGEGICSGTAEPPLQSALADELPVAAAANEINPTQEPSEELIHSIAMQLAQTGDQIGNKYSGKLKVRFLFLAFHFFFLCKMLN